jgi:hypothetical protein
LFFKKKKKKIAALVHRSPDGPDRAYGSPHILVWVKGTLLSMLYSGLAALLVAAVPESSGSGVPQVVAFLNGASSRALRARLRTGGSKASASNNNNNSNKSSPGNTSDAAPHAGSADAGTFPHLQQVGDALRRAALWFAGDTLGRHMGAVPGLCARFWARVSDASPFGWRIVFAKSAGNLLAVGAGLPSGSAGPLIAIGTSIGAWVASGAMDTVDSVIRFFLDIPGAVYRWFAIRRVQRAERRRRDERRRERQRRRRGGGNNNANANDHCGDSGAPDADDDDDDDDDYDGYMTQRGYYKDNYDGRGPGSERTERESLASTMSRRTQSVRVIDERFEESLKAYDAEDAIGELDPDGEDVQGHLDTEQIDGLLDEFLDGVKSSRTEAIQKLEPGDRKAVLCAASAGPEISEAELSRRAEEGIRDISKPREREQWDCETVISTYSNLENHPRLIEVIRPQRAIRLERGLPVDYLPARDARGGGGKGGKGGDAGGGGSDGDNGDGDNDGDDDGEDGDDDSEDGGVLIPMRVKGETAEEKRLRKLAVKEAKREARVRKKDLKTQFKKEEMRQTKQRKNEVSVRPL